VCCVTCPVRSCRDVVVRYCCVSSCRFVCCIVLCRDGVVSRRGVVALCRVLCRTMTPSLVFCVVLCRGGVVSCRVVLRVVSCCVVWWRCVMSCHVACLDMFVRFSRVLCHVVTSSFRVLCRDPVVSCLVSCHPRVVTSSCRHRVVIFRVLCCNAVVLCLVSCPSPCRDIVVSCRHRVVTSSCRRRVVSVW
jgi:hypothetical protein